MGRGRARRLRFRLPIGLPIGLRLRLRSPLAVAARPELPEVGRRDLPLQLRPVGLRLLARPMPPCRPWPLAPPLPLGHVQRCPLGDATPARAVVAHRALAARAVLARIRRRSPPGWRRRRCGCGLARRGGKHGLVSRQLLVARLESHEGLRVAKAEQQRLYPLLLSPSGALWRGGWHGGGGGGWPARRRRPWRWRSVCASRWCGASRVRPTEMGRRSASASARRSPGRVAAAADRKRCLCRARRQPHW